MTRNRRIALAVGFPTILGTLAVLAVALHVTAPVIFPDTTGYVLAGQFDPHVSGFRTPLYGWLIIAGFLTGVPALPVFLQCLLWIGCIAATSLLVFAATESVWRGIAAGTALVALEVVTMHLLPANWFLLTDALYAETLTLGLLLLSLGIMKDFRKTAWSGALLAGMTNAIRPLLAGPVVASVALFVFFFLTETRKKKTDWLIPFILLWIPTVILCTGNAIAFGTPNPSSQSGMFLMNYAIRLTRPGDIVFADPELNLAFHETIEKNEAPAGHRGRDPYLIEDKTGWDALGDFYASVTGPDTPPRLRFRVSTLSTRVTLRLIGLHPAAYARLAMRQTMLFLVPDNAMRSYWWPDDPTNIVERQTARWTELWNGTGRIYHGALPGLSHGNAFIHRLLDTQRIGLRLRRTAGPVSVGASVLLGLLCLLSGIRLLCQDGASRWIGAVILIFLLNTLLHAGIQGGVTLATDARYRLPGIMTAEIAVILMALSFTTGKPRAERAHPPAPPSGTGTTGVA